MNQFNPMYYPNTKARNSYAFSLILVLFIILVIIGSTYK